MQIKKIFLPAVLSLLGLAAPPALRSQQITLQTVSANLLTNAPCGATITATVPNQGQTVHSVNYFTSGAPTSMLILLQGSFDGVNFVAISDEATNTGGGTLTAIGYWPVVRVNVLACGGGASPTITAKYTGAQVTPSLLSGNPDLTIYEKPAFTNQPGGSGGSGFANSFITLPYGNTSGLLMVSATNTLAAGSSIAVTAGYGNAPSQQIASFPLPTSVGGFTQIFQVPEGPADSIAMGYFSGGASTATINAVYFLRKPGFQGGPGSQATYTHITGTTATVVKGTGGFLHTLTINTGAAGTISIFDLLGGSCTGTPSTNTVAVITVTATTLETMIYDVNMFNGICVKASVAMDLTVAAD